MWKEIFPAAGYILNRCPTRSLGFKTPIGFLKEYLGEDNPEPFIAHIQPYGCKAFSFIKNRPKLDKLGPRAEIGYLVGYDSTNIFRIWIPSKNRVISTRDVTFDPKSGYSPKTPTPTISDEILDILEVPQLEVSSEDEEIPVTHNDWGIDNTIPLAGEKHEMIKSEGIKHEGGNEVSKELPPEKYFVSRNGIERKELFENSPEGYVVDSDEYKVFPSQEIVGDVDTRNIIQGKRHRKPKIQYYFEIHQKLDQQSAFHAEFQLGPRLMKKRLHKSDLPPPPENWYQLKYHSHEEGFNAAAQLVETLKARKFLNQSRKKKLKSSQFQLSGYSLIRLTMMDIF